MKQATKTWNLFCFIVAKWSEKRCCTCYHPRIKPVLQQMSFFQVPKSSGKTSIVAPCFAKACTCCAFYLPKANLFCSRWRNPCVWREFRVFLSNQKSVFTRPDMLRDRFDSWMVTCATSLSNSFCSNAKQVARFCCPFDRSSCSPHAFPLCPSQPLRGSAVLHPWKRNTKTNSIDMLL